MRRYHPLTVLDKRREARDAVRIVLDVPPELRDTFAFQAGQHLPLSVEHDGKTLRRTYSICSPPGRWPLEIGVRVQPGGAFSTWADTVLKPGDTLAVMPPFGQFHANPVASARKTYLAVAAGSGITPILSIVSELLEREPSSRVLLFYGNRRQATTMFIDDLYALKNRFPGRVLLHFVFSREEQELPVAAGRIDAAKLRELWDAFCTHAMPDEAFLCGPDSMIDDLRPVLAELGLPDDAIHSERFGAPRRTAGESPRVEVAAGGAEITVILDGHRKSFAMPTDAPNIVDAGAEHGVELPYSCKGGVCATCRCLVTEGEVTMAVNYGLEPWEVEKGYVLACQSRPLSERVTLDYDTV